jgi:hypothetical protein
MSTKGRSTPRVVCCAIPIARAAGKVLVITSRKRPNYWVCEYPHLSHPFPGRSRCLFSTRPLTQLYLLFSAQRRLGVHRRCTRGCCFERGLGRRSNPLPIYPSHPILTYPRPLLPLVVYSSSWCAWHNYTLCNNYSNCCIHLSFLRARRRKS